MVDKLIFLPNAATVGTFSSNGQHKSNNYISLTTKLISKSESSMIDRTTIIIKVTKTLILIVLFMMVGPALILLNKFVMQDMDFPYPLCLSGFGIALSAAFARVLVYFKFASIERSEEVEGILYYRRVLPVGIAFAGTLATGNMVYLLLDVGLIQMLKSFTPVVMMTLLFFTGIEIPDRPVMISILIISFGTALTCSYTPDASILGLAVMLASEIFEAVRLVLTQFLLKDVKLGVVEGQYVLSPPTAAFLFLASLLFEFPHMMKTGQYKALLHSPSLFIVSAVLGVIVNFLSYHLIQLTSSLSLKVLVMFRNFFVILIGIVLFEERTSSSEFFGYFFAIIGFAGYNAAKMGLWVWDVPEGASLFPNFCPSYWSLILVKDYDSNSKRDVEEDKDYDSNSKRDVEEDCAPSLSFPTTAVAELRKKKTVRNSYGPNLHICSQDSYDGSEKTSLLFDQESRIQFQFEIVNESHFHFTPETYSCSLVDARS